MAEIDPSTVVETRCKRCGHTKAADAFSRVTRRIGGRDHTCKSCRNSARSAEARARSNAATKAWKLREREHHLLMKRRESERRRRRLGMRSAVDIAAEHQAHRTSALEASLNRREDKIKARIASKPWSDPDLTPAQAFALRYRLDAEFNLKQRLRAAERRRRRGIKIGEHLRGALIRNGESKVVFRELGYTIVELRRHLERQFTVGMNWSKFMAGEIHIDHRRPLSSFDLTDHGEWRRAWALTNLQPLWASDNLAKGAALTLLI